MCTDKQGHRDCQNLPKIRDTKTIKKHPTDTTEVLDMLNMKWNASSNFHEIQRGQSATEVFANVTLISSGLTDSKKLRPAVNVVTINVYYHSLRSPGWANFRCERNRRSGHRVIQHDLS